MADRPIIFSAAMVRALLAGRKTQTRRLATSPLRRCAVGDRLYVRESLQAEELDDGSDGVRFAADGTFVPIENTVAAADRWVELNHYGSVVDGRRGQPVPAIHMPRWASRLTLIVEGNRVEQLRDISPSDAIDEGWPGLGEGNQHLPVSWYMNLWQSLHDKEGQRWEDNPEVLVLSFGVVRGNIDRIAA